MTKAKSIPSSEGSEKIKSRNEREHIYEKLERLNNKLREALKHVLLGYCTINSLVRAFSTRPHKAKSLLSSLVNLGWLDVLRVRPFRGHGTRYILLVLNALF